MVMRAGVVRRMEASPYHGRRFLSRAAATRNDGLVYLSYGPARAMLCADPAHEAFAIGRMRR